jgi:transposase
MESGLVHYDIYCGVDVGKWKHYMVALDTQGEKRFLSRWVDQTEAAIRQALGEVSACGNVLVTVDQTGNIGRLVVAVAQSMGIDVAHLPPQSFHKVSELYGEDKTDAKDAYIIADTSRAMPRLIEYVGAREDAKEELQFLLARHDDITHEGTALYNRTHDLLLQICPPLEVLFSKEELHNNLTLHLLAHYGGPDGFKRAGKSRVSTWAGQLKYQKVRGPKKVEALFCALSTLTLHFAGTAIAEQHIKKMATQLLEIAAEKKELERQIAERAALLPEVSYLMSMPGTGIIYGTTIVVEIEDIGNFKSPNHLASYGGVTPKREISGTSVNRNKKAKGGNRRLKNALVRSAGIAVNCDVWASTYYNKKRAEGKKHKSALLALARRRVDVIYALLKTSSLYEPAADVA